MRSHSWYEANSYCADTDQRHEGVDVTTLDGELVAYICAHCLERIRPARRGSPLWVAA